MVGGRTSFPEYALYRPEFGLVRNRLTPTQARRAFAEDMEVLPERMCVLAEYARPFGVVMDYDDAGIERVYQWLAGIVSLDESVDLVAATTGPPELNTEALVLDAVSLSLAWDFGLFLGEAIIRRRPSLGWELGRGPRNRTNFQRPVVGHYVYPSGYVRQWEVMWTAQASLEGAAVGEYDTALARFVNFWPDDA